MRTFCLIGNLSRSCQRSFRLFRIPGTLATTLYTIANYVNSDEHKTILNEIISSTKAASLLTADDEQRIVELLNENTRWLGAYLDDIETILSGQQITEAPITATAGSTQTVAITSTVVPTTTQGAGSLIVSVTVLVSCAIFKMFV